MTSERSHSFEVTVRKTFLIPIIKIILLQIVFVALYFLLLQYLNEITTSPLKSGGIILFLVLQTVQSFWSLYIIIKWFFTFHEITLKEISVHSGFFIQKKKYFSLEKAETVTFHKGFFGQLFNFGTIDVEFFMSNQRQILVLPNISNPEKYASLIEQGLREFGVTPSSTND
jgi:uncharacterized membrane protein YdbT with pleckstrin-like domain